MSEVNKVEDNIENIDLGVMTGKKFLDYSMYVIMDRALPDIRDGLKPVHRRIIFAQDQLGNYYNKPPKKSARVVGDVIGKYHPHGDSAVYEALVRMAQPFSMRANLVDGQGNFGSIDGDSAAAMRYTECRQSKFADSMFEDMGKETVKMVENYDGTELIPEVLPVRFPNLLINGTHGIAVGMASYIPTHNPMEVLACVRELIECKLENREASIDDLMLLMPAPDFPTGGLIHSLSDMKSAWEHGRCKFKLRSKWHQEETISGRVNLVITEIPYQVKKELLIEKISHLASPDKSRGGAVMVEGISDIQEESDRDIRIVISLKKDVDPEITFNSLAKYSQLETPISYNMTVLVGKEPKVVGILNVLEAFLEHRESIIINRTIFADKKAKARAHFLEGLAKALSHLDEVIAIIKASETPSKAVESLVEFLQIEEDQAKFIMEMKLSKLTSSQRDDLENEIAELKLKREGYALILASEEKRLQIMMEENEDQITMFANTADKNNQYTYGRRLSEYMHERLDTDLAALTKEENCTILFSNKGYIRRMPISEFEQQNRGTRGKKHMKVAPDDFIQKSIASHSHAKLAIITQRGQVYGLNAYELPDVERGRHLNNIIELSKDEKILMILPIDFEAENSYLTMITKNGFVKRTSVSEYANSFRKSGLRGIEIRDDDELIYADVCKEGDDIVMVNSNNLIIRFSINSDSVRPLGRTAMGVKGMKLDSKVNVIGGAVISSDSEGFLSCVTNNGMVKITKMNQYRTQNRGGKGVRAFKSNEKTGDLFKSLFIENLDCDLVTTTKNGVSNRINVGNITVTNRNTSGVKLIKIDDKDSIADVFNAESLKCEDEDENNFDSNIVDGSVEYNIKDKQNDNVE